jgi:hypothetical protein
MRIYISVLLLSISINSLSQVYIVDQTVPVEIEDKLLTNPWAGGLNAGQYSTMDVNRDGVDDLVVFDRTSSKINVFVNSDNKYLYAPELATQFPKGIENWMLLRDFNCDGKKDIFTSDPLGIRVYVNESGDDGLKWRIFNSRAPQPSPLLTKGFSASPINIQLNSSDIPSIEDVDGDGDLDILVFRFSSLATVEFHKNINMEVDASCDSLQFERITQSWGEFEECGCGTFAFNGEACPPYNGGKTEHQSGKSLLTLDMDGDGDYEAIISEEGCADLHLLPNVGNSQVALMNSSTKNFPGVNNRAALFVFPAAYYEDVDFDGIKDLLVAPNVSSNVNFSVDFKASGWLYHNEGTNDNPSFSFVQKDFLQDQMLDFGENSAPAFIDYDNDGDQDMFVGMMQRQAGSISSSIMLFSNTGTASLPKFNLIDDDFLSFSLIGAINIKPQFADVNNDGLSDFVFSATETAGFSTNIYYLLRTGSGFSFSDQAQVLFPNIGMEENYKVFDLDGDGLLDLLLGRSTGRVEYYKNTGNGDAPVFTIEDQSFYGLDFSPFRQNATCEIADLDGDGKLDLIVGDSRGNITYYTDFLTNLAAPLEGETELIKIGDGNIALNIGSKIKPVAVNLFNTDKPTLVLGTGQGGLSVLRNEGGIANTPNSPIGLYPNPVRVGEELIIKSSQAMVVNIIAVNGQVVMKGITLLEGVEMKINVSALKEGLYIVTPIDAKDGVVRFVVTR